ncbi:MAG: T9SS type A sorting domain-containing protein [Bacteroidota bacterium]
MKIKFLLLIFFFFSFVNFNGIKAQAIDTQDSLALVDLYNSTNGPGWINSTNWLTTFPVSSWFGVNVYNGRVDLLLLGSNKLEGVLPTALANLALARVLDFHQNQLTGNVPASMANLTNIGAIDLSDNQLNGTLPAALQNLPSSIFFRVEKNRFTFNGLEYLFTQMSSNQYFLYCNPQADIPINRTNNLISVSAGGTISNNTYKWYRNNTLVATITGDSTYSTGGVPGNYSVEITNSVIQNNPSSGDVNTQLTLFSISTPSMQDSLALVDLYNSTNGQNWVNNTNWLTTAPLSTWYGVTVRRGKVTMLNLPFNKLAGVIPLSAGNLTGLTDLVLPNNLLTGSLPASFINLFSLSNLNLSYNGLSGSIPDSIGSRTQLKNLDLSNNQLSGNIPTTLFNVFRTVSINLANNQFSGTVPPELADIKNLDKLFLHRNQLSGTIPGALGRLTTLTELMLDNNQLTGSIPDSLGGLINLALLSMASNQLTGKIPDSLGKLSHLRDLILYDNQLSGTIPSSLLNLHNLYDLHIGTNKFNFDGMETLPAVQYSLIYSPQANLPLHRNGNLFSVSAGGTLTNDSFRLYKDGVLSTLKIADSTFEINSPGRYYITVSNSIATKLILLSDSYAVAGLQLVDSVASVIQSINGTVPINIEAGPYHKLLLTVTPTQGANALNGDVDCKVTIDPVVASYNNQPYVQRHYDISPAINAASAAANVKLYFTQQEFNNFNAFPAHGLDLPTSSSDTAGIANLRVYQYHGFSTTSLPGSYTGAAIEIDPSDANIVWNAAAQYWEVSFDVTGFSGFFVSSQNSALLPLTLLSFTGKLQGSNGLLQWVTSGETHTSHFEIQRSTDGNNFKTITIINAAGNSTGSISYQYTDLIRNEPLYYYRLKMNDIDNRYTYSKTIKLTNIANSLVFTLSPNPTSEFVLIKMPPVTKIANIKLIDMSGRMVQKFLVQASITQIKLNLKGLTAGSYKIVFDDGTNIIVKTLIID